eukprot:403338925
MFTALDIDSNFNILVGGSTNDLSIASFSLTTKQPTPILILYKDGIAKWGKQFYSQTRNKLNSVSAVKFKDNNSSDALIFLDTQTTVFLIINTKIGGITKTYMFDDEDIPSGINQGKPFPASILFLEDSTVIAALQSDTIGWNLIRFTPNFGASAASLSKAVTYQIYLQQGRSLSSAASIDKQTLYVDLLLISVLIMTSHKLHRTKHLLQLLKDTFLDVEIHLESILQINQDYFTQELSLISVMEKRVLIHLGKTNAFSLDDNKPFKNYFGFISSTNNQLNCHDILNMNGSKGQGKAIFSYPNPSLNKQCTDYNVDQTYVMKDGQHLPQFIQNDTNLPSLNVETFSQSDVGVQTVNITAQVVVSSMTYIFNMSMEITILESCKENELYAQNQSDKVFIRNQTLQQQTTLDKFIINDSYCQIEYSLVLVYFPNMSLAYEPGFTIDQENFNLVVDFSKIENVYKKYRATIQAKLVGTSIIKSSNEFDIYIFEQQNVDCSSYSVNSINTPNEIIYDLYSLSTTPITYNVDSKCLNQTLVSFKWQNGSDPFNAQFQVDKNDNDYSLKIYSTDQQLLGQTLTMQIKITLSGKSYFSDEFKITIADNLCSKAVITPSELLRDNYTLAINQTTIAIARFAPWDVTPSCGSLAIVAVDFYDGMNITYNSTLNQYFVQYWSDDYSIKDGMHLFNVTFMLDNVNSVYFESESGIETCLNLTYKDIDQIVYPLLFGKQVIKIPDWKPNSAICGSSSDIQYQATLQDFNQMPSFMTFDNYTLTLTIQTNNVLDVGNYRIVIFGMIKDVSSVQEIDVQVYLPCERNQITLPTLSNYNYKIGSGLKYRY